MEDPNDISRPRPVGPRRRPRRRHWAALAAVAGVASLWPVAAADARTPVEPAPSGRCSSLDFEKADVADNVLTVSGTKPWLDIEVSLVAVDYIQQPEYWLIQVIGCHPGDVGLPAEGPYTATLGLAGIVGTRGIEVAGATRSQKIDLVGKPTPPKPAPDTKLAGTSWVLEPASLGVRLPKGRTITAAFDETTISGSASCNRYNGPYSVTPPSRIKIGALARTKIGCDTETNNAENQYLRKLQSATAYRIVGSQLVLTGRAGTLRFRSVKAPTPGLVGSWTVTGIFGGTPGAIIPVAPDAPVTLDIKADGTLGGKACNDYSADYKADAKAFDIGLVTSTLMLCTGVVGEQEARYFPALESAAAWRVESGTLILSDANGRDVITAVPAKA